MQQVPGGISVPKTPELLRDFAEAITEGVKEVCNKYQAA